MRTRRSEDGRHPYFDAFRKRLGKLKFIAYEVDPFAHIIPKRMGIIRGNKKKTKIKIFTGNSRIILVKLYGHKLVQKFDFIFTTKNQARQFYLKAIEILSQNGELN